MICFILFHSIQSANLQFTRNKMRFLPSVLVLFVCSSDKGVTKFNSIPEAYITSHNDGYGVLEGYSVIFMGTVSDPNHSYDQLMATWFSGTEMICPAQMPASDGTTNFETIITSDDTNIILLAKDIENATGDTQEG